MSIDVNSKPKTNKPNIHVSWQKATLDLGRSIGEINACISLCRLSFMPHHNPLAFPHSRDYVLDNFVCKATKCIANRDGYCITPSLCKIGEDGRCLNYKEKGNGKGKRK